MAEEFTVPKHNLGFFSFLSKDWCHLKHWNLPQVWIMFMLHHQDQGQIYNMRIYVYTYITYLFDVMYVLYTSTPYVRIKYSPYTCVCIYKYVMYILFMHTCIYIYIYVQNGVDTCKELYTCHMYIYKIIIYIYIIILILRKMLPPRHLSHLGPTLKICSLCSSTQAARSVRGNLIGLDTWNTGMEIWKHTKTDEYDPKDTTSHCFSNMKEHTRLRTWQDLFCEKSLPSLMECQQKPWAKWALRSTGPLPKVGNQPFQATTTWYSYLKAAQT